MAASPQIVVKGAWLPNGLTARLKTYHPRSELGRIVKECFAWLPPHLAAELLDHITGSVIIESALHAVIIRADGQRENHGWVSRKVVTTAGVNYIAARMANTTPSNISLFNFHGIGTGTTAEAIGDTALVTELTTQYNPDSTRATGVQSNPSANVYQTVATNAVDATVAITEHGVMTQAATGAGTLLDRSVFSALNLVSGDQLTTTYQLTLSAGG